MDLRRLRVGEWITAVSGLVLLVSLFLPWYEEDAAASLSGWEALTVTDVVLAVVAMVAVVVLLATAIQPAPAVPLALDAVAAIVGMAAVVVVLVRVAALPGEATSREWGLWLGLAGVLGIAAGGWIAMRDQRLSKPGKPTDLTGLPIDEQAEVEALPTPGPRGAAS